MGRTVKPNTRSRQQITKREKKKKKKTRGG